MSDLKTNSNPFEDWDVISVYTRAQAIADGVLVDVSQFARELGFRYPVAITRTVWNACIETLDTACQDESGRLYNVLWAVLLKAKQAQGNETTVKLRLISKDKADTKPILLKSVCGPGDTAEPVITIMIEWED